MPRRTETQPDSRSEDREPEPITLDTEVAGRGGEAPTPYEVLIHAALLGNNNIRFNHQDGIAEQWRIMQPLPDKPPTTRWVVGS